MQVNVDDDNVITNNIQEIFMTRFPICSATKEQIVWSTQIYRGHYRYNIHTHINKNTYVTMMQFLTTHAQKRNRKKIKMKYIQQLYCITYTNIAIQTP